MKRQLLFACLLLGSVSCDNTEEKVPELDTQKGKNSDASIPTPTPPAPGSGTTNPGEENVPLKAAALAGYPKDTSTESVYKITVSEVTDYKWKANAAAQTTCSDPAGYSAYQTASTPLNLDISFLSSTNLMVKLCVVGRNSKGMEQETPTEVSWQWTPPSPGAFEQLDFIDGDNQVKIIPKATNIQWLVIRSRDPNLGKVPVDGTLYTVNERFGTGVVLAVGTPAEVVDTVPQNREVHHYTVFSVNAQRRFSPPIRRTITLAVPSASWVQRDLILPGYVGLVAIPNSNRVVCRARHLANGRDFGFHTGRTQVLRAGDVRSSVCVYEYFSRPFTTNAFEALMANKGDPMRFFRWERQSGGTVEGVNSTTIPERGAFDAGMEITSDKLTIQMYVCRGYSDNVGNNLDVVGKAAASLAGCLGPINNNDTNVTTRGTLDILVRIQN